MPKRRKREKSLSVRETLLEWYLKKREEEEHEPLEDGEFYASMAGKCPRRIYYEKKFPDRVPGDYALGILMLGDILHEKVQEIVGGEAEVDANVTVDDIIVKGRADIVLPDEVIELKTISKLDFVRDVPKLEHMYQLCIYMKALGKEKGRIVYIDKRNLQIVEHYVHFDEHMFRDAINTFRIVKMFEDRGEAPPRFEADWCRWCPFREICWNEEDFQATLE